MLARRLKRSFALGAAAAISAAVAVPGGALAAGPPQIASTSVEAISATGVTLRGSINPNGLSTTYRFEYQTEAAYLANLDANPPRDGFVGAALAPAGGAGNVGAGTTAIGVGQRLTELTPTTAYRYRLRAVNSAEATFSPVRPFGTQAPTNVFEPLDDRGWEMVSPTDKNGGAIQAPGTVFGGGVFQAAAAGGAFTYSSADSFGTGVQGASTGKQYVATRGGGGWASANITTPLLSGSYGDRPDGVPYQLFSADLSTALMSNGERCRGDAGGECPVANPPLPGSGAPVGYRDYYRRNAVGGFESLLTAGDLLHTTLSAEQFEMRLAGATPDLRHVVVTSCAALSPTATEVIAPGGCDPAAPNLYEWSGGALAQINVLPGEATGTPGAALAAPNGAISSDGSRVYFYSGGDLYLRDGSTTKAVGGAGATFEVASAAGSVAYAVEAGRLFRYVALTEAFTPVSAGSEVEGVLGASADGGSVYYAEAGRLFRWAGGAITEIASSALPSNLPAATGAARVSADGSHLVFLSGAELTGFPSEGQTEVFLYGPPPSGGVPTLTCVSCSPTGAAPRGPSSIPGAVANGGGPDAFDAYRPRVLSADSSRVFFDSEDSLSPQDTNGRPDVYEWEGDGAGTCARPGGCVQLISTGRSPEGSTFLDASAEGGEAFFLTSESIYPLDPGSYDVYDARIGGGFTLPPNEPPCEGDACQILPTAAEDPTPGTLTPNSGNPPLPEGGKPMKEKKKPKHKAKRKKKHRKVKRKHMHKGNGKRTGVKDGGAR